MLRPLLFLAAGALLGSPRAAEIGPGGIHTYTAELTAGRAWLVEVDQQGVDVTVEIAGTAVDNPVDRQGKESLLVEPETSGVYEIAVRAREAGAPSGRYEIRLVEVSGDRRIEALRAVTQAGRLYLDGSKQEAVGAWREALASWKVLGERREEARALYALTVLSRLVNEPREAVVLGREALPVWQSLEERLWEAATWNEVGLDLWMLGETAEARSSFERALALQRQIEDRYGQAVSLSNLCVMDLS